MTTNTDTIESVRPSSLRLGRVLLAFGLAMLVALLLGAAAVLGFSSTYDGKVLPGVHVGSVDLGGLTPDQARARLAASYGYLGEGKLTVETPKGNTVLSYKDAGREADVDAMANAALGVGRSGDAISEAAQAIRSALRGNDLPVLVKFQPKILAGRLRQLSDTTGIAPQDAVVEGNGLSYSVKRSIAGKGLDEAAVAAAVTPVLADLNAPSSVAVQGKYILVPAEFTDAEAQAAADEANRMIGSVTLNYKTSAGKAGTLVVPAQTVYKAVTMGPRQDGTYGPTVDASLFKATVTPLAAQVKLDPVNPTFLTDRTGKPVGVTGGRDGAVLNVDKTTQAIAAFVQQRAGASPSTAKAVAVVTDAVAPKLTNSEAMAALPKMVRLPGATWTTTYFPGEANGWGANIAIPARNINGYVVAPGDTFSFWQAVGPVDYAHGFRDGGVIIDGRSQHTGAIGGGICSASTTAFNAALRGGFQIVERHPHFYYIDRYPKGLDATVFQDGSAVADMRWRNDSKYPVLIRSWATNFSGYSTVTFELWGVPDGRKVSIAQGTPTNYVPAGDGVQYVTTLKPGQTYRAEYPTAGFNIYAWRTVTDASGKVLYKDTFYSHYGKVDGLLQIGKATAPTPTPTPTPKPTPTPGG